MCTKPAPLFRRSSTASRLLRPLLLLVLCAGIFLPSIAAAQTPEEVYDPIEPFNRAVFWFNDTVDVYVLEPVARGYDYVTPNAVQECVGNFFNNLRFPVRLVSDLVQFKFEQAAQHTSRFLLNTTLGIGGLLDPATELGLPDHYEDFGTALANRGVGQGFYLVLPFLGPSTARDALGRGVDVFLDPTYYFGAYGIEGDTAFAISAGLTAVNAVDTRAGLLGAVESAKDASLDYYGFLRKTYYQIRYEQIYDKPAPEEEFEDFNDDFEDDFEDEAEKALEEELERSLEGQ